MAVVNKLFTIKKAALPVVCPGAHGMGLSQYRNQASWRNNGSTGYRSKHVICGDRSADWPRIGRMRANTVFAGNDRNSSCFRVAAMPLPGFTAMQVQTIRGRLQMLRFGMKLSMLLNMSGDRYERL
jgi:hypothetical protein